MKPLLLVSLGKIHAVRAKPFNWDKSCLKKSYGIVEQRPPLTTDEVAVTGVAGGVHRQLTYKRRGQAGYGFINPWAG